MSSLNSFSSWLIFLCKRAYFVGAASFFFLSFFLAVILVLASLPSLEASFFVFGVRFARFGCRSWRGGL